MRHGKKINHLGRTASHRSAMMSNMASSLITHKRINTTLAKAKSLQRYIEPLITKSKTDDTNNRRVVFKYLQNKESVAELFREVAPKVADRPGGYTRIIKTGFRQGDSAEMAMIELVDFNELYTSAKPEKKTRRSRRGGAASTKEETTPAAEVETKEEVVEAPVEEPKAETTQETPEATTEEGSEEEKKD
ncbi:50S ribosomal protein L17 [Moheibacter sediminis]|uniref:Large ribosomal subunit protein bL17 n=1 Tax=Moheibacter sediminis TaxID=1434700 RepID=A0A1W2AUJ7_9FLAO|nr:50S ribosomal protein L17 [Moheibacter sediminis]SMC64373.1 large subunit ribosomal protein L17 [Moheibacter sediminis]